MGKLSSHDIRNMKVCDICGSVGVHRIKDPAAVAPIVLQVGGSFCHPACIVEKRGVDCLLRLPTVELREVRLCDISPSVMRKLLADKGGRG